MWIEAEDNPHSRVVDAEKLDTMYVSRKGYGSWAVVGTILDRDILLKGGFSCEADALAFLADLVSKLS